MHKDRKLGRMRKGVTPVLPTNTFYARYEGTCPYCNKDILIGHLIRKVGTIAAHDRCFNPSEAGQNNSKNERNNGQSTTAREDKKAASALRMKEHQESVRRNKRNKKAMDKVLGDPRYQEWLRQKELRRNGL